MSIIDWIISLFYKKDPPGTERLSPGNWIPFDSITYDQTSGRLTIELSSLKELYGLSQNPLYQPVVIPDKNSMDPVFDVQHNPFVIAGATPEDHSKLIDALQPGDIAAYWNGEEYRIHRIVKIETDSQGKRFTFLGDNNAKIVDPWVVRPEHITFISLGTFYTRKVM